jgi:hypothetical protein
MKKHIFYITSDCRGHHWKIITIYNATKVHSQQNLLFLWTKKYFWTYQKNLNNKNIFLTPLLMYLKLCCKYIVLPSLS